MNPEFDSSFEFELNGVKMYAQKLSLPGYTAFRVSFSSARKPLVLARADNANCREKYTEIPLYIEDVLFYQLVFLNGIMYSLLIKEPVSH